jgi:hypothetical protein
MRDGERRRREREAVPTVEAPRNVVEMPMRKRAPTVGPPGYKPGMTVEEWEAAYVAWRDALGDGQYTLFRAGQERRRKKELRAKRARWERRRKALEKKICDCGGLAFLCLSRRCAPNVLDFRLKSHLLRREQS